jgi:hypothetical protein
MKTVRSTHKQWTVASTAVVEGAYLRSDRDMYYVEHVGPERVLIEDCRTNVLLDASFAEAEQLLPVARSDDGSSESTDDPATDDPRSKDVGDQLPEEQQEEIVRGTRVDDRQDHERDDRD